uniref:Uncharacterized protein n=1 Tax=Anguilla anguilla TaxID=7936 RepID=A0A0E9SYV0_ANGAN
MHCQTRWPTVPKTQTATPSHLDQVDLKPFLQ